MPSAQAGEGGGVRRAEQLRGAAAAGSCGAITTARFPAPEPQTSGSIPLLTTNFSGGRRRQRCRALWLQRRLRHRLGARGRRQLCAVAPPGSERAALARPPRRGARGRGAARTGAGPTRDSPRRATGRARSSIQRGRRAPPYIRPGAHPAGGGAARGPATGCYSDVPPPHVADSNWLRGRGSPNTLSRPRL